MPLDPLIALFLMLLLWASGIGYILYMAVREARRARAQGACLHQRRRALTASAHRRDRTRMDP